MTAAQRSAMKLATSMDMNFAALDRLAKSKSPVLKNEETLKWMDAEIGSSEVTLARSQNERATRLLYILNLAKDAFGSEEMAKKFLMHKHPKLGTTPLAKLETEWGGREVERILNGMIHGLPY
jgi:uncharacterized protein (DUF2384 family)